MIDISDDILPKNEAGILVCPKCHAQYDVCACPQISRASKKMVRYTPQIRIEKSGRKGKIVTLILKLPRNDDFLQELTKNLKSCIGCGGTCYNDQDFGTIEIQGDQRKAIEVYFDKTPVFY